MSSPGQPQSPNPLQPVTPPNVGQISVDQSRNQILAQQLGIIANSLSSLNGANNVVSFTPTLTFGGGSSGMTGSFSGEYFLVGKIVFFNMRITLTAKGASTGTALLWGNLPPPSAVFYAPVLIYANNMAVSITVNPTALLLISGGGIRVQSYTTGNIVILTDTSFTNTSDIIVNGTYFTV